MWTKFFILISIFGVAFAETTAPGIDRKMSEGIVSRGYKVVYGDEDMEIINEVVTDMEKSDNLKNKIDVNESIPPLPAQDVKCLMSVDRYCSKDMGQIKGVLIQAIREDCQKCTTEQKEQAGKVIAAMMAHDPVAWKMFLTRSAIQNKPEKKPPKQEKIKYKLVGEPEEIVSSKNRYTLPGVKVRVKRYVAEKMS
ncbi:uncharacterized protein LOC113521835 [Galleria mellonella]|uniref:Uncharacterized protein LOC113521835 n=1 Tax=Galleria mellonella TaxID=7137 RepID=A0A6J1X1Q6_GALME|nr:uncharacterized protein LOC113521835 [Galleria mellonella]